MESVGVVIASQRPLISTSAGSARHLSQSDGSDSSERSLPSLESKRYNRHQDTMIDRTSELALIMLVSEVVHFD